MFKTGFELEPKKNILVFTFFVIILCRTLSEEEFVNVL